MDSMGSSHTDRVPIGLGLTFQDFMELLFQIDQKLAGMLHHDTHGRILDVTGRKPFMDIFGGIAYVFRYIGEQGDDIVVCHLFDFMDPIQFKISLGLDVMKSIIRDNTQFVHGFTGKNLNLDHGPVFIFFRPDGPHFFTRITWNHSTSSLAKCFL